MWIRCPFFFSLECRPGGHVRLIPGIVSGDSFLSQIFFEVLSRVGRASGLEKIVFLPGLRLSGLAVFGAELRVPLLVVDELLELVPCIYSSVGSSTCTSPSPGDSIPA